MFNVNTIMFFLIKYAVSFLLLFFLLINQSYAVIIQFSTNKTIVDEGETVDVTVTFEQEIGDIEIGDIDNNTCQDCNTEPVGCTTELKLLHIGSATQGVDYTISGDDDLNFTAEITTIKDDNTADGGNKKRVVKKIVRYTIHNDDRSEPDELISATIESSGSCRVNSIINISRLWPEITIRDAEDIKITNDLQGTLDAVDFVQEGSGNTEVGNIIFSLSPSAVADANCHATAEIRVVGGSAEAGVDYDFITVAAPQYSFGLGDENPKNRAISFTILPGRAGDGDKTIELEATFTSNGVGGREGNNSCPLTTATTQRRTITIIDSKIEEKDLQGTLDVIDRVQEGASTIELGDLIFTLLPNGTEADEHCHATANVKIIGGTARRGVDYSDFTSSTLNYSRGNSGSRNEPIRINILEGRAGDGDRTIELEATFTSNGSETGNSCPLRTATPQRRTVTIIDSNIEENDLLGTLEVVDEVPDGSGFKEVGNIIFTLPLGVIADANCNATAEVKIIGGTARRGIDYDSFITSTLRLGQGDRNSKLQSISINILQSAAGDGDKTIILEATFKSHEGDRGNSCPLKSETPQRHTITIKDTATVPLRGELTVKDTVQEGQGFLEVGSIKVSLPDNVVADDNCRVTTQVRVVPGEGTARVGVDYDNFSRASMFFGNGDGNSKSEPLTLNILRGNAGDEDKTIVLEAIYTSNGVRGVNSCPLNNGSPLTQRQTIKIIGTSSVDLNVDFDPVVTTVKKESSVKRVQVATINFNLPNNREVDANCHAVAKVKVVGGTAISGKDYNFIATEINFGNDGRNTISELISLDILPGKSGDADKTIELEASFISRGGRTGNSCPLSDTSREPQKIIVNVVGRPVRPKVELKLENLVIGSTIQTGKLPVIVTQTPIGSNIDCSARVVLTPSDSDRLARISPTTFDRSGGEATISIISRGDSAKSFTIKANLIVDEEKCDKGDNTTVIVTIAQKFVAPTVSSSSSVNIANADDTISISYTFNGDISTCSSVNPFVAADSTATPDQYSIDTSINLLEQSIVPIKILKSDIRSDTSLFVGAVAQGCDLVINKMASIRIAKRGIDIDKADTITKQNDDICRSLRASVATSNIVDRINRDNETIKKLTGDRKSRYLSNCRNENNIKTSRNIEAEEVASQGRAVLGAADRQLRNVRSRLDKLRMTDGRRGVDVSGANIRIQSENISASLFGGGGGDGDGASLESRWGVFTNGEYGFGSQNYGNDKSVASGDRNFDFNSKGLTVGADYRFPDEKLIGGAAIGYKDFEAEFTSQEGGTNTKGYNISVYGTYLVSDKSYVDAVVGIGSDKIETRRPVNNDKSGGIGKKTTFAVGRPDAKEFTVSVGGGYEFNQGGEWTQTPYARVDYVTGDIDAYTESASHASARTSMYEIDKQDVESLTSTLGLKVNRTISTSSGVFVPHASVEWRHEFKENGSISGQSVFLVDDPQLNVSSLFEEENGSTLDKNYYNLDIGVSAAFENGRSAYLNFESRLGDSIVDDNAIKAGFRWSFY